jgi:hypothetical protein
MLAKKRKWGMGAAKQIEPNYPTGTLSNYGQKFLNKTYTNR